MRNNLERVRREKAFNYTTLDSVNMCVVDLYYDYVMILIKMG